MTGAIIAFAFAAVPATAQSFEASSVRPAPTANSTAPTYVKVDPARIDLRLPLQEVICMAYSVRASQVAGPEWLGNMRFDIEAKLPEGATEDQIPVMLQSLLAERFHLSIHRENRLQSVYAVVADKRGLKMKPAPDETAGASPVKRGCGPRLRAATNSDTEPLGYKVISSREGDRVQGTRMATLIDFATLFVREPVIDKTNLKGSYRIVLDLPLTEGNPNDPVGDIDPVIVSALEKLGLKLEPQKAPVETIVVDHVDAKPAED